MDGWISGYLLVFEVEGAPLRVVFPFRFVTVCSVGLECALHCAVIPEYQSRGWVARCADVVGVCM